MSERTIRRWVAAGQLDGDLAAGRVAYSARPPVPHKLDAYKGIIDTRLAPNTSRQGDSPFTQGRKHFLARSSLVR